MKSPSESLESHGGSQACGHQCATHGDGLQSSVHHLAPVAGAATLEEIGHVVATREWGVRNIFSKELAQRAPAITDLVFQQALGRHQAADFSHVVLVDLLALVGEVPTEEGLEELAQHGIVHAGRPTEIGNKTVFPVRNTPPDGLHDRTRFLISTGISFSDGFFFFFFSNGGSELTHATSPHHGSRE